MKMVKKIGLLALTLVLGAAMIPVAQATSILGAVGGVDATENTAIGGTAACRVYSVAGADTGINDNFGGVCLGVRCIRPYSTNTNLGGGYVCNGENTTAYNTDADSQTMYELIDAEAFSGTCGHVGLYSLQGLVARNGVTVNPVGSHLLAGCAGTNAQNCFSRADDANARQTPILNTKASLGGTNQVNRVGGLSPIPVPKVTRPGQGGCGAAEVRVTWDDPESYSATMKDGVTSPLLGVRLWKSGNSCSNCPSGDIATNGWTSVGMFDENDGPTGACVPIVGDTWFAISVRVRGPSSTPTELETGIVGGAGFVGANSQCVQLVQTSVLFQNATARYVGRASVNVEFTTGVESGVTSFYVRRSATAEGPFTRVGSEISTRGDGTTYAATDKVNAAMGKVLYYQIEAVMSDGTTQTSGVTAVALPSGQKKLGPDA